MKKYDVIIVGSGITGVSAAIHLLSRKIDRILILDPNASQSVSAQSAGFVLGGQRDNITRVAHAHGEDFAKTLWNFGDQAFLDVKKFATENKIPFKQGKRYRLITSDHEMAEVKKALEIFSKLQFDDIHLNTRPDRNIFSDSVLAVQDEGDHSAWMDLSKFFEHTTKTLNPYFKETSCLKIEKLNSHWKVLDAQKNEYQTEFVVLASHLADANFVPSIASAFVSAADQWSEHNASTQIPFAAGSFFSANHGLEWGGALENNFYRLGGARFLRPLAGFEATEAPYEKKIENFLVKSFEEHLKGSKLNPAQKFAAGLDCVPCDELPIIGPMFGENQKLIGAGYMGSGIAMGFRAGKCLAEIISTGQSNDLPRRLHPERLRSL